MAWRERKRASLEAHAEDRSPQEPARTVVNTLAYEKNAQLHEQLGTCIGGGWLTAELGPRSADSDLCKQARIPASLRVGNCPESPEGCGCGDQLSGIFG